MVVQDCDAAYYSYSSLIQKNDVEAVEALLINGINPNYNPRGKIKIPLIEAVISSSINVVSILLRHRALPYLTLNGDGTALHYAAALGHTNIVRLLIRHEANINSPNKAGYTPLFLAIQYNHIETARHLIEMGASLHAQCKETALTLASYAGHYQLVKTITSKVPNEEKDQKREYYVALSQASFKGFTRIIKLLLRLGADVNASYEGVSPPLFASIYGNRVITARYLISKNANIEARNQGGYTPLMEAAKRGHEGMMKILLDAGADTNAKSLIEKETAYEFAQSGKFHDVCVLLAKHNIKEHAI
ncbi:unnamed protein product [Rodentolepis nana]|uniref:ANK_REP_REGION domain-containing protein n=1 Tax=Rodentolepis nana TaxID=102285 RepID=A0A0R3TF25_RODNA|nr:unnamed protein product [Rodentolepis nana]